MPKIPELPPITEVADDDLLPIEDVSDGKTKRATVRQLRGENVVPLVTADAHDDYASVRLGRPDVELDGDGAFLSLNLGRESKAEDYGTAILGGLENRILPGSPFATITGGNETVCYGALSRAGGRARTSRAGQDAYTGLTVNRPGYYQWSRWLQRGAIREGELVGTLNPGFLVEAPSSYAIRVTTLVVDAVGGHLHRQAFRHNLLVHGDRTSRNAVIVDASLDHSAGPGDVDVQFQADGRFVKSKLSRPSTHPNLLAIQMFDWVEIRPFLDPWDPLP